MSDIKSIAVAARDLRRERKPFLLATVVAVHGSSYRKPGARLLIADDRRLAGSVSGGCLERELIQRGWWHTRETGAALLAFDSRTGAQQDGAPQARSGCGGVVEILLEQIPPDASVDPLEIVESVVATETEIALLTVYRSSRSELPVGARRVIPGLGVGAAHAAEASSPASSATLIDGARRALAAGGGKRFANVALPDGSVQALAERLRPPPHLFVFGSGPDAEPVVSLASMLGWTCTVWDRHARFDTRARFAAADHLCGGDVHAVRARVNATVQPLAVVMSHDFEADRRALEMLLLSGALYIGVLGPRRRTDRLLAGLSASSDPRLHAPVGLSIGAETPDEIALAIAAEVQAVLADAVPARARERARASHAPPGHKPVGARSRLRQVAP